MGVNVNNLVSLLNESNKLYQNSKISKEKYLIQWEKGYYVKLLNDYLT